MSSSTKAIVTKNSTMNNNERKRPISSSIRLSSSPTSAKRRELSLTTISRKSTTNKTHSISTEQTLQKSSDNFRSMELTRSVSMSNSTGFNPQFDSNEFAEERKIQRSLTQTELSDEILFTKRGKPMPLIVKSTTISFDQRNSQQSCDSDDEFETIKSIPDKSNSIVVPSSVMTIVTTPDSTKKSIRTTDNNNVIIQQVDGNLNTNSSTKLVKFVGPPSNNSSSAIKMLSTGDGLASALRIPAIISLTSKTSFITSKDFETNFSSVSTHSINSDQSSLTSSAGNLLDIPIDMTEKQSIEDHQAEEQSNDDYQTSNTTTSLPPTPPPPVIDPKTSTDRSRSIQREEHSSTTSKESTNKANQSLQPSSHLLTRSTALDWSVPPTLELSPTSITSSSPDLSQNLLLHNDSFVESDSNVHADGNENHSKSSTRSSNIKVSSSPRLQRRRRDPETTICHQNNVKFPKSSTKINLFQSNDQLIIQGLLNDMTEMIASMNNSNTDKNSSNKFVPKLIHSTSVDSTAKKREKSSNDGPKSTLTSNKKRISLSQSMDLRGQNESRFRIPNDKELDDLAFRLYANSSRAEFERMENSTDVDQRLREIWSQMTLQKKNMYYKRVLKIYKKPHRDVLIAPTPNGNEKISSIVSLQSKSIEMNESSTPILVAPAHLTSMTIELQRQTSTPLSFHSVPSSITDEQSISSPQESVGKTTIFTDVVNELINGVKGLDKLSCSQASFTNAIHDFVRSNSNKQSQTVKDLEKTVEKKCSAQLTRATIFWTQKINYFAMKHSITTSKEIMNELTLIVKYFYLFVLSLNCRKQEIATEAILTDLLNGKLTFNESFCSAVLTSIIEDLILRSSLANDYLLSQPILIGQIEHSLPFVRNVELETELLNSNESFLTSNPFGTDQELEDFLNHCGHLMTTTNIPIYPSIQSSQHSPMYYPAYHPATSYYYRPPSSTAEMNNYYYSSPSNYPSAPPIYQYNPTTPYYPHHPHHPHHPHPHSHHHSTPTSANVYNNNEQFSNYYYSGPSTPVGYSAVPNSNMDIPLQHNNLHHRTYRPMTPNMATRKFNHPQQISSTTPGTPSTPAVFDTTTVVSPQKEKVDESSTPVPSSLDQLENEKTIDESTSAASIEPQT